ncbi:hypothetical protein AK830_g4935 [Neonectria ditissima]|uniref:Altered inheritance of mitochondria protein 6 n=1 Tax=Neonectria ditissima TaxID=78410 RepID=A0A0P7AUR7_9HYPO|nr:hypothetical protein AK830_g4935 [Neonectria ditissima]
MSLRAGPEIRSRCYSVAFGLVGVAFSSTIGLLLALIIYLGPVLWNYDRESPRKNSNLNVHIGGATSIPCSSHDDYWREVPLYSALHAGCIGVEADVWTFQDELYVSHDRGGLSPNRTSSALYIDPLFKILQEKNPMDGAAPLARGIYDYDPSQTLVLLVDIKANPRIAWPLLLHQLQPLRNMGWLSHIKNGTLLLGPITVVGTGTTQVEQVEANPARDVFLDAPLAKLESGAYSSANSYYASVSFRRSIGLVSPGGLRQTQLLKVRDQIQKAHSRGLKVRYWSLSAWPLSKQNRLWATLVSEGLDILHIDDLLIARDVLDRKLKATA